MKRPTIRLGYVMELVATAAVCLAVVRSELSGRALGISSPPIGGSFWLRLAGGSLLTGLALAGSVGLAVETGRGRRPSSWGLGRWIWSIAGFSVAFYVALRLVELAVFRAHYGARTPPLGVSVWNTLEHAAIYSFYGSFGWAMAALCATAMIARSPRDPVPDAREWAGRLFASLVVAFNIAEPLLHEMGR